MTLGGLEDEGELHLAGAEELADDLHAVEEMVVDDLERLVFLPRLVEVFGEVLFFAVDDVAWSFCRGEAISVAAAGVGVFDVGRRRVERSRRGM